MKNKPDKYLNPDYQRPAWADRITYNKRGQRIWHDGYGDPQRPGTYHENEVKFADSDCIHDCEKKLIIVHFFQGGYDHKMRWCKKCHGLVSADMIDHPRGQHEFCVRVKDGMKCKYCDIVMIGGPIMCLGGSPV